MVGAADRKLVRCAGETRFLSRCLWELQPHHQAPITVKGRDPSLAPGHHLVNQGETQAAAGRGGGEVGREEVRQLGLRQAACRVLHLDRYEFVGLPDPDRDLTLGVSQRIHAVLDQIPEGPLKPLAVSADPTRADIRKVSLEVNSPATEDRQTAKGLPDELHQIDQFGLPSFQGDEIRERVRGVLKPLHLGRDLTASLTEKLVGINRRSGSSTLTTKGYVGAACSSGPSMVYSRARSPGSP